MFWRVNPESLFTPSLGEGSKWQPNTTGVMWLGVGLLSIGHWNLSVWIYLPPLSPATVDSKRIKPCEQWQFSLPVRCDQQVLDNYLTQTTWTAGVQFSIKCERNWPLIRSLELSWILTGRTYFWKGSIELVWKLVNSSTQVSHLSSNCFPSNRGQVGAYFYPLLRQFGVVTFNLTLQGLGLELGWVIPHQNIKGITSLVCWASGVVSCTMHR
jgi:hypothetical protein